jgi:hypothetical protein
MDKKYESIFKAIWGIKVVIENWKDEGYTLIKVG